MVSLDSLDELKAQHLSAVENVRNKSLYGASRPCGRRIAGDSAGAVELLTPGQKQQAHVGNVPPLTLGSRRLLLVDGLLEHQRQSVTVTAFLHEAVRPFLKT